MLFPFKSHHKTQGKELVKLGYIKHIIFSEGTYQVEVYDPEIKETFWPFLQLSDEGKLQDAFCTCKNVEKENSCPHLAAAYFEVNQEEILHLQFQNSFWNQLCFMAFKRHGSEVDCIKKWDAKIFGILSSANDILFGVKAKQSYGEKILDEYIFHRVLETEETSLKFSNLSSEELELWHRKTPTQKLQYELSFWSDLAKWMFLQQHFKQFYKIYFQKTKETLPKRVFLAFSDLDFEFYIAKVNWEDLIPSLSSVVSPLKVYDLKESGIEKITYDPIFKKMHIHKKPLSIENPKKALRIQIGKWEFEIGKGFFLKEKDSFFSQQVIDEKEIGSFLTMHYKIAQKYLSNATLSKEIVTPLYHLRFDAKHQLHISFSSFEEGDLLSCESMLFPPWVYLKGRRFCLTQNLLFDAFEVILPKEKINEFIHENKLWLNQYEGFQIHLSNMEFHLTYHFDGLNTLYFDSETEAVTNSDGMIDFGDWLYINSKGFYKKTHSRVLTKISPKTKVSRNEISLFILNNREELEQVKHFFNPICPIEKIGLIVSIDFNEKIHLKPEFTYKSEFSGEKLHLIGDFTYIENKGFHELPRESKLPEKYRNTHVIEKKDQSHFIMYELEKLKPFISKIDQRLEKPRHLNLKLNSIQKDPQSPGKNWIIDFSYESEIGEETIETIKKGIDHQNAYAITQAGLIFFKDVRFNWLKDLSSEKLSSFKQTLSLSTLDWMRLRLYEDIKKPLDKSAKSKATLKILEQLDQCETDDILCLDKLKSKLRPYQEAGVKWLWFLYSLGLSGLLCDDMGLGKTHQAMALLAGASHLKEKIKCLIVCPTSVLYHWEELLRKFLPDLNVIVFYGTDRSIEILNGHTHLLLTSYGILRSEKKMFSKMTFDIAIFDEIQIAKNAQSQTHRSLEMICASSKIGLTGTPIENRLMELKALFDLLLPGYFPLHTHFRTQFVTPIEKHQDKAKKALLSRLVHPFILRRKKSEVLEDLPEKIEEIAYCFLSDEQKELYKKVYLKLRDPLVKELEDVNKKVSYLHIFSLLNILKQICNHPSLFLKDLKEYNKHKSGKWDLFVELVAEVHSSGQKLVVFTQFLDMIEIMKLYLKREKIGFASIKGSTQDRKEQLKKFQEDPNCSVFIGSLRAVGTGVDLTSGSVVIHYDRWWNPAKENQATDRVHRIGQNRGVQVFKMVTKQTIEEYIHWLIQKKKNLLEGIVGYDDQDQIKRLHREDFMVLFEQINRDIQ